LEIDQWVLRSYTTNTRTNYNYSQSAIPVRLDFFEHTSDARVTLEWDKDGYYNVIDRLDFRGTSNYSTPPTATVGEAINTTFAANSSSLWLKADAGTGTSNDNTGVTSWQDQAGSNNASTSGVKYPVYHTNEANFNPGLQFDGVDDQMNINRPAQDDFTFALVVRPDIAAQSGSQWWQGDGIFDGEVAGSQADFGGLSMVSSNVVFGTTGDHSLVSSNSIYGGNVPHIIIATRSASSGLKSLYIDGNTDNTQTGITGSITNPSGFKIGSLYSNNNYYDGFIFEILTFQNVLSASARVKVESYFALKYGLTLSKNYVLGAGEVYNIAGYGNDIAGIGNESDNGFDQRVASSINTSSSTASDVTIATTNDFTSTNQSSGRSSLSDDQFLIWGHNGGSTNSWQSAGSYNKVNRTWKVQNTGNVGSVNLQINLSGYPGGAGFYYVLVDNDENFSNGIVGAYKLSQGTGSLYSGSVTFPNGTSFFSIGYQIAGQNVFWVKADSGTSTTTDNSAVNSWSDQSGNSNSASQGSSGNQPTYQENEANFNPVVLFDGTNDFMSLSSNDGLGYGSSERTSFVVARENSTTNDTWSFVFAYGTPGTGTGWCVGKHTTTSRELVVGSYAADLVASSWGDDFRLITGSYNGTQIEMFAEGSSQGTLTTTPNTSSGSARLGRQVNNYDEFWGGEVAEVIHYSGTVSGSLKSQIETYLAVKYGITKQTDYTVGNSTIYSISGFGNEIAGIGNDSTFGLDQRVSSSIGTSDSDASDIVVATTNNFTASNNDGSRTSLSNGQYLIWGHDNKATSSWITEGSFKRVTRAWKVQNTGNIGNVNLQINLSGYPSSDGDYYLIVDSDNDFSNGVTSTNLLSNTSGNLYSGQVNFPNGTSYFSISTVAGIEIELQSYTNVTRNGASDGVLTIQATGGLGNYSYSWNNGGSTNSITGLSAGTYTVTVSSGSLSTSATYYLYNPDLISTSTTVVSPNCPSDETGEVDLSLTLPNTKCISFDGSDDYVALNDSKSGNNAFPELTVCAWVKVPAGQGGWAILDYDRSEYFNVSVGDNSGGDNRVHFDTHSEINDNIHDFNGSAIVADNTWHHVACVYDGEHKFIYVDGVLDASTSSVPHNNTDIGSNLVRYGFIGDGSEANSTNGPRNNLYFQGRIALVELWTRALGEQEIRARMNSSETGTGLVGLWKLEEGSGTSTTATVGGDGTLYGNPAWETDSFYSASSYAWTKDGDGAFSESTEDITNLGVGTYNYSVQVTNGYTVTGSETVNASHQNIATNPIQIE
jgi:hypothetical protein